MIFFFLETSNLNLKFRIIVFDFGCTDSDRFYSRFHLNFNFYLVFRNQLTLLILTLHGKYEKTKFINKCDLVVSV